MSSSIVLTPGVGLTITASSINVPGGGFGFLSNVIGIVGATEIELIPGHILRKATNDEITAIKEILAENNGRVGGRYFYPWEMEDKGSGVFDDAPEEDWKYFVVAFSGTNEGINSLEQAFALLDSGPRIGFTVVSLGTQRGVGFHPGRLFQALREISAAIHSNRMDQFVALSVEDCRQIRELVERLSKHAVMGIDIPRVSQRLVELQALDANLMLPSLAISLFSNRCLSTSLIRKTRLTRSLDK